MLGKYWSIILLAGLAVAAIADVRRALYSSAAPWITIAVGALRSRRTVIRPATHDFVPTTYTTTRTAQNVGQMYHRAAVISRAA